MFPLVIPTRTAPFFTSLMRVILLSTVTSSTYTLFGTFKNVKPFVFKQIQPLLAKHPGGVPTVVCRSSTAMSYSVP